MIHEKLSLEAFVYANIMFRSCSNGLHSYLMLHIALSIIFKSNKITQQLYNKNLKKQRFIA